MPKPIDQMTDEELDTAIAEEEKKTKPKLGFKSPSVEQEYKSVYGPLRDIAESVPHPITITSGRRSVQENAAVGGVPNSYHTVGGALDIRKSPYDADNISLFKEKGYKVIDEGDHLHVQPRSRNAIDTKDPFSKFSTKELDDMIAAEEGKIAPQQGAGFETPNNDDTALSNDLQGASAGGQRNPYIRKLAEGRLAERTGGPRKPFESPAEQETRNEQTKALNAISGQGSQPTDPRLRYLRGEDLSLDQATAPVGDALYGFANFRNPLAKQGDAVTDIVPRGVGTLETILPTTNSNPDESLPFSQRKQQNREIEQEVANLRKKQSPVAYGTGRVGGDIALYSNLLKLVGAVPGLAPAAEGEGASVASKIFKGLARGSATGLGAGQFQEGGGNPVLDTALGAGGEALGPILEGVGNKARDVAPKIINSVLKTSDKNLKQGKNIGKELLERGLYGSEESLLTKANAGLEKSEKRLQSLLENGVNSERTVDKKPVIDALEELRGFYDKIPGREGEVEAINSRIATLKTKTNLTPAQANDLKRSIYQLREKSYGKDIVSIQADIEKSIARGLKQSIEDIVPESKSLNKELNFYGGLKKQLKNNLAKGEKASVPISLKDLALSSGLGLATHNPLVGLFGLGAKALGSTPLGGTLTANQLNKIGKLLQKGGGLQLGKYAVPIGGLFKENNQTQ